jgi:hypothetical protein
MSFFNVLVSCFITSLFFYSFGNISNKFFFKIAKDDEVIENDLCYYNAPPCTHKNINIRKESLLNFYVKYVVDNKD